MGLNSAERYKLFCMMYCKPSSAIKIGGRPLAVISFQNATNIGQESSGSRAPSSQSRLRVMLDCRGMGTSGCSCESSSLSRMVALDLAIAFSQLAV